MTVTTPAATDLRSRVAEALPVLRRNARWNDENRRLHEDTLGVLLDTGVTRMRVPLRYGGHESDANTLVRTVGELARGDGAAAWNTAVWAMGAWLAGLFPDHVQDEVFGDPDVRVCGVLSPTATARQDGGDLVVDGRWAFISGALHSQWQVVLAMAPTPDGAGVWPVLALVPMAQLGVVDDWYTSGLRGTGSVTTVAEGVRVPLDRVLPMPLVLQEQYASRRNADSPVWRAPMMATGCGSFIGVAASMVREAISGFLGRLDHKITYTDYESSRTAPITHHKVAEAVYLADEAEFHAQRLADLLDRKGLEGAPWDLAERVAARAALGRVFRLAESAVDVLATGSGGSSLYATEPIQRIRRDVQALNLHALMHPDTNAELYGRVLCGVEPNTAYL
jgi:alkylation response protein AidB-like acyl-CoA dehydrogenase